MGILRGLLAIPRLADEVAGLRRASERIADALDSLLPSSGKSIRSYETDSRLGATEEAALIETSDEQLALYEFLEKHRMEEKGEVGLEEDLEEIYPDLDIKDLIGKE